MNKDLSLCEAIRAELNQVSREDESDTPDFILAEYLIDCLNAFEKATKHRNTWYSETPLL